MPHSSLRQPGNLPENGGIDLEGSGTGTKLPPASTRPSVNRSRSCVLCSRVGPWLCVPVSRRVCPLSRTKRSKVRPGTASGSSGFAPAGIRQTTCASNVGRNTQAVKSPQPGAVHKNGGFAAARNTLTRGARLPVPDLPPHAPAGSRGGSADKSHPGRGQFPRTWKFRPPRPPETCIRCPLPPRGG